MVFEVPFRQVGQGIVSKRRPCIHSSGELSPACKSWLDGMVHHPSILTARPYSDQDLSCPTSRGTLHPSESDNL